ncbi:hypothetical protein [Candidatus Nitrospira bockiana]
MSRLIDDPLHQLREEFRQHLAEFYARLKLAPPYHSVEKAVATLTAALRARTPEERMQLLGDPSARWREYEKAFVDSGLHLKHRGIIAGLVQRGLSEELLPGEYGAFLRAFRDSRSTSGKS